MAVSDRTTAADTQWVKVLFTVLFAAFLATLVAVSSVWIKLETDQKFQKIDAFRIKNSQLRDDISKLDASLSQLQSLGRVEADLAGAGITMELPHAVFFINPGASKGSLASGGGEKPNGSI